ncbi:MAG: tetratricopeptide repeat protein [Muribaculaceae bacterium]|nr:tetratricopeptide repeat protein [Muribaculaceae bacterium]
MNKKFVLSLAIAAMAFTGMAQTHSEGVEYYEAGQYDNAKELLERNLNNAGTDKAISYYYQGLIALENGNKSEAAKFFNLGAQANPDYAYNYIGLARIDLMAGTPKVAEANFKKAESLGKKDAGVQIAIARAYDSVDPSLYEKEIAKRLEKARKINMQDPDIYIFEGDVKARNRDYGGAGASYEMAANYDPNATAAYFKYANLFSQVNPQYGINMLKKLLQLNPNSALGQRSLANAYYDQNQFKEAASEYGKYVKNPNHFKQDEDRYAFLLFYGGDYQAGYDYATQLLAKDPNNFTAQRYQFMNAAQIKSMSDKLLPMAQALYQKHLADPKKNTMAPIDYTLIADEFSKNSALSKEEAVDSAISVMNNGIEAYPTNASFYKTLSMLYVDKNDMAGACNAYDSYLKNTKDPGYNDMIQAGVFALYAGVQNKADAALSSKFYQQASDYIDKAAELYPSMYRPDMLKGDIALNKGDQAAQIDYYVKAIDKLEAMDGDKSRYQSHAKSLYGTVAKNLVSKGNKASAKDYVSRYLKLYPQDADFTTLLNSL